MSSNRLYIGLDIGGSKTKLLARTASQGPSGSAWHLQGPGANPKRAGREQTTRVLTELVGKALDRRPGAHLGAICAGIAGAGSDDERQRLAARLRRNLDPTASDAHLSFVDDARIALETAFPGQSGMVIGAGTGSVVRARTKKDRLTRSGGWGHVFGDQGSGYALGRVALRAVAAAHDGGPPTLLRPLLAREHDMDDRGGILRRVYDEGYPLHELAPSVLHAAEEGDAVATRLLREQTALLARQGARLAERCSITPRIGLFGGLTDSPTYAEALRHALREELPRWTTKIVSEPPVTGALHLALCQNDAAKATA